MGKNQRLKSAYEPVALRPVQTTLRAIGMGLLCCISGLLSSCVHSNFSGKLDTIGKEVPVVVHPMPAPKVMYEGVMYDMPPYINRGLVYDLTPGARDAEKHRELYELDGVMYERLFLYYATYSNKRLIYTPDSHHPVMGKETLIPVSDSFETDYYYPIARLNKETRAWERIDLQTQPVHPKVFPLQRARRVTDEALLRSENIVSYRMNAIPQTHGYGDAEGALAALPNKRSRLNMAMQPLVYLIGIGVDLPVSVVLSAISLPIDLFREGVKEPPAPFDI